jgi:hypothetical protein
MTQSYVVYHGAITRRSVAYRYCRVLLARKFEKLRAMLHSAASRRRAMQVNIYSLISSKNFNRFRKCFRVFFRALGAIDLWKKWRLKISCDCLFNQLPYSVRIRNYTIPDFYWDSDLAKTYRFFWIRIHNTTAGNSDNYPKSYLL